ncbi:ExeM/NucH family extracellular endonuclease [Nocardioides aquiterrae]|uniref:LTD domain-containing protein n=1 Tax=Nocardioides aquiterrae TaxID=203799 RepID=A0ABP4F3C9_9ACTN
MSTTSRASRGLAVAAGLAAAVTGLALLPTTPASAASTGLVISEAYGGGGNSGATYTHDFIELYNPTSAAISVDGMSVQYRSSGSAAAATGVTTLSGSVPAGGHYLVQEAQGSGGSTPLPTPNATGTIAMSGTAFTVWLASGTTALNPAADGSTTRPGIVDLVGVNSNTFETAKTAGTGNATSVSRTAADSDDNATDFTVGAPNPENGDTVPPAGEPTEATIAEIQGTGDTSPLAGRDVVTEGVVTAAYPTGGFNGFYLQSGGSGGSGGDGADATPGASDAVYVFGSAATAQVAVGDSVRVEGTVTEFNGLTEIGSPTVTALASPLPAVAPHTGSVPAAADREAHEGELWTPTDDVTVTNTYSTNQYAEIGLAAGDHPLIQPTDVADAQDHAAIAAVEADNADRGVVLDDGSSINFLPSGGGGNQDIPLPWLSKANPIRVGAAVHFTGPVVLDWRNSTWKLQPTHQVTDSGADVATFENTRTENAAPGDLGGDLRLATFNVLNYFNTTGVAYDAAHPGACTYYDDRDGNHVTDRDCGATGPRGAAEDDDLQRQRAKIVAAINELGASIVSLEEIENSVALGEPDRDDALASLVDALNAAAGAGTWAFVPSPAPEDLPPVAEQDVIRTAFIYRPATVTPVGGSEVLTGAPAFSNAREPLAQAFKAAGAPDRDAFAVVVNHFKSKGSGTPNPDGQGNANADRVAQAEALWPFAERFAADRGTDEVFLTGDFNSYTQEDPLQVLYAHGYTNLASTTSPGEATYSFGGLSGSLDHVLANDAAAAMVTGVDVWQINAEESVAFEYSRHNYNATDFYEPNQFRASDHDPEVVGLDLPETGPVPSTVDAEDVTVVFSKEAPRIPVTVTAGGLTPIGTVTLLDGARELTSGQLSGGSAVLELPKKSLKRGTYTFTVSYAGDSGVAPGADQVTVRVTNPAGH